MPGIEAGPSGREQDRAVLGTLEGGRTRALQIIDRLGDAGLEIVEPGSCRRGSKELAANEAYAAKRGKHCFK